MKRAGETQGGFFTCDFNRAAAAFLRKDVLCADESAEDDNDLDNGNGLQLLPCNLSTITSIIYSI